MKPHVDAVDMEAMLAFRQQPCLFTNGQFTKADCAFQASILLEVFGLEDGDGEGVEDCWVESMPRDVRLVSSEDEATRARGASAKVAFSANIEEDDDNK